MVLHLTLEQGLKSAHATDTLRRMLPHAAQFVWLTPPDFTGCLTVVEVNRATTSAAHHQLVMQWASEVWQAWAAHHEHIRQQTRQILG